MLGVNSTNALKALIYKKQLKMSNATNKQFKTGEIINFVQSDAGMLYFLSGFLPVIATIPIILTFCICALFYKLGCTFFAGMVIIVISIYVNYKLTSLRSKIDKLYKKKKDGRINLTTECLTNIKIIKIYGWTDIFKNMISEKR